MIDRPLVLLGAPGSGKGTLTRILTGIWPVPVIATGELLRREAAGEGTLAARLRSEMEAGALIREEMVNQIVAKRLAEEDCGEGFIMDGYPRTRSQATYMDRVVKKLGLPVPGRNRTGDLSGYGARPHAGTPAVPGMRCYLQFAGAKAIASGCV